MDYSENYNNLIKIMRVRNDENKKTCCFKENLAKKGHKLVKYICKKFIQYMQGIQ